MKNTICITILALVTTSLLAQPAGDQSLSVFSGAMFFSQSILSTSKLGYEKKHLGISADFTYDSYREKWDDGSKSTFTLYGASVGARYYTRPMGRGFFAEGFGGYGLAQLNTCECNQGKEIKVREYLPLTGLGLGYRFGKRPKGFFGEIAYRTTIPLKNVHLYTTDEKPDPQGLDNISYQSWIFEKGKASGQLYVGIGYSF